MASTRYPQRVRNDLRFRELNVLRTERVSAGFQRIVLGGEALEGFSSRGFDDHTKVFFPAPGTTFVPPVVTDEGIDWGDGARPQARDYTRCTMTKNMSWRSISSFMMAALPATGR